MEKAHAQYQDLLKETCAATLPTTLKVTSSTDGFKVMDPFDWTLDKNVYQRWLLWSHKAKLALEAMEGDTEKTKISYLHHWLNGEGISKIEGWKNSKILISQEDYDKLADKTGKYSLDKIESYFTLCELILTPRSNPLLAVEDLYLAKQGSMTSGEFHSHILKIVKRCQFPCQQAEERAVRDAIFMGMNSQRARATPQAEQDTYIDENGVRQPNPPMVNMLKIVNHIGTTSGSQEKHLKFPIDVNSRGPYKDHLVVRVDTGADVNCMNEKTFRRLFPKVKLSACPYEIQNFGNSIADISILGQFCTYLQFRGEKYLNTFIVTNANDCPNLLSHGATFRMGVLLPNYPEENVVKGENVPNFKFGTSAGKSTGMSSNVFQILQDLWLKQCQETNSDSSRSRASQTSKQIQPVQQHS